MKKVRGVCPCYPKRKPMYMLVNFFLTHLSELSNIISACFKGDKKMVICTEEEVFTKECSQVSWTSGDGEHHKAAVSGATSMLGACVEPQCT